MESARTPAILVDVRTPGGELANLRQLHPRRGRYRLVAGALTALLMTGCSGGSDGDTREAPATAPRVSGQSSTTAVGLPRSAPVRVRVPAIGVDSDLLDLGLRDNGTLEVPPDGFPAGWFTGAPTPGEIGPAIIVGHVDWNGEPGVFYDLRELSAGDEVTVTREDGSTLVFSVTEVAEFPKDDFPTERVYGNLDYAGLRLITCGGSFDSSTGHYEDNIVAFAQLSGST